MMTWAWGVAHDGTIPLSEVAEGRKVRVVGVDAGVGLTSRLTAMGVVPGCEILMVSNKGRGPAVVEVRGTRLALGRGMTRKILVCELEQAPQ